MELEEFMTQYSLFPAFVKTNYHSAFGNHVMTVPLVDWASTPNVNGAGSVPQWDSGLIDLDDMMNTYIGHVADVSPNTVVYDDYIVFTYASAESLPHPVAGGSLAITGTLTEASIRAASATFNFRTTGFHPFKIVLLDTAPQANFEDTLPGSFTADHLALINFLKGNDHGICGRDGLQPAQAISITYNINDKLKRRS